MSPPSADDPPAPPDPYLLGAATTRPTVTAGVVTDFDRVVGLGTVRAGDGVDIGFHCTQIADGSRDIAVGAAVDFVVLAGRHGRWEAGAVRPT